MKRKVAFLVVPAVVLAAAVGGLYLAGRGPAWPPPKLNVLLITLDTTRADHLGCYGYVRDTSPNLDRLAADSVQFDHAVVQAAVTPVSHASILTGLDPYNHGLRVLHGMVANRLGEEQQTLAEVWREVGGQTSAFVSAFPVTASFGLDQGYEHFDARFSPADDKNKVSPDGTAVPWWESPWWSAQRRAGETTQAAIEWLDKKADPDSPLCMWVHYFDPHDPYLLPPQEFRDKFEPISQRKDDILRAFYDAEVFYMDFYVGQVLEAFKQRGLWDNTIVVVVADHGEGLGDHNWWTHGILYQEQIRVPLIIRIPGLAGGVRVPSLVRSIDLMPTILEAAGVERAAWPPMDGESLIQAMHTGRTRQQRLAYADSINMLTYGRPDTPSKRDHKDDKLYCLMDSTNKLIYHQLEPNKTEFYDLAADPRELKDLAASRPPAMQVLIDRLERLNPFSEIMPGMTPSDLERVEKLRSLGYTE